MKEELEELDDLLADEALSEALDALGELKT